MFLGNEPIHINAQLDSIAPVVLMPGDPLRAKYIAQQFLTDAKEICNLRNMLGYTGFYKGLRVSVIGSGMGMPSMGIYAFELFYYFKVEKIIRIGTCGAVDKLVDIPDLILANKVYSESNFAYTYNDYKDHVVYPLETLNNKIIETAKRLNIKLHVGTICSMDVFGPYIDYERVLNRIPENLNVLGEEMEAFALCHIANSFEKSSACIVTAVDSKFSNVVLSGEQRQTSLNEMILLGLESLL